MLFFSSRKIRTRKDISPVVNSRLVGKKAGGDYLKQIERICPHLRGDSSDCNLVIIIYCDFTENQRSGEILFWSNALKTVENNISESNEYKEVVDTVN